MNDDINKLGKDDIAHTAAKVALGFIPVIGSAASELFSLIITPPLEKRRAEWMNDIATRLKELESKEVLNIVSLKDNEQFIDVILQATSYALKTSETEKIKAFQNAIINTATGDAPDKAKTQIFLNQLDNLTDWHIKILDFINNPTQWYERRNLRPPSNRMTISGMVLDTFHDLQKDDEFFHVIWNNLISAGLIGSVNPNTMQSPQGLFSERCTQFGKEFLEFIKDSKIS